MTWIQDHFGITPGEFFARESQEIYNPTARLDDRYTWEEITPGGQEDLLVKNPDLTNEQVRKLGQVGVITGPQEPPRWADGMPRYRLTGCAHKGRDAGGACLFCGESE